MANDVIFDTAGSDMRFNNGATMKFIQTNDQILAPEMSYSVTKLLCCSPVKDTKKNWFYLCPSYTTGVKSLQSWIDEISPEFPTFDIRLVRSTCKRLGAGVAKIESNNYLNLSLNYKTGYPVNLEVDTSVKSGAHYSYTNSRNFAKMSCSNLDFLVRRFIEYCIERKINITKNFATDIIKEFVAGNILKIKEDFSRPYVITIVPVGGNGNSFKVEVNCIADIDSITPEKVVQYLIEITNININTITDYIHSCISVPVKKEKGSLYVQALYSKKTYRVEAYLAHHLIRAGLNNEFNPFIEQYFQIKKALPEMYFWNLIFLTQFGFNFYYYYWLTADRTFKLTDKKTFLEKAHAYTDTSSLHFLRNFYIEQNGMTYNILKKLYIKGEFAEVARMLGNTAKITVREDKKAKLTNLRIADSYEVLSMDDKYYHVRGDDFRMHKYLKSHFNIIREAV